MKKISIKSNFIYSLVLVLVVILFMGFVGDYFFDLNDDVLMKDLLSGAYTGTPEGHNIQMLYPISAVISLFYRVIRGADWYGIFLCICQYLSVFAVAYAGTKACNKSRQKLIVSLFVLLFSIGVIGSHFLFVQYTFTCGMMSAAAAFLILMHEKDKDKYFEAALGLIFIAFLLRSEMLLLTLPMVCVAIFIRWALEIKKEVFMDCLKLFGAMITALVIAFVIHQYAFSSPDWKEYTGFFDARTELYDYQYIPDYEENKDFYDEIGLDKSEYMLLVNYNFGLDDKIDADVLNEVASYAAKLRTDEVPLSEHSSQALSEYMYRLHNFSAQKSYQYPMSDYPWNLIVIVLYLGVLLSYLIPRQDSSSKETLRATWLLILIFLCRSSLWLYIIMGRRDPIRITHPLYLIETVILLGMLIKRAQKSTFVSYKIMILAAVLSLLAIPNQMKVIEEEQQARTLMRSHYDALYDYFADNKDNFYFIDVYTSVSCGEDMLDGETSFSEKLFDRIDNSYANHDLMGGWGAKSPLTQKKLSKAGFADMESALLTDKAYVVQNKSESTDWISDYYRYKGIEVTVEPKDTVADAFTVYAVRQK